MTYFAIEFADTGCTRFTPPAIIVAIVCQLTIPFVCTNVVLMSSSMLTSIPSIRSAPALYWFFFIAEVVEPLVYFVSGYCVSLIDFVLQFCVILPAHPNLISFLVAVE
jgi:hypothetical protein